VDKAQFRREAFEFGLQAKASRRVRSNCYRAYQLLFKTIEESSLVQCPADQIPDEIFTKFVALCKTECDEFDLYLRIGFVRIVLIACGRDPETLTQLKAPTKRRRVRNAPNGRYQFVRFPVSNG
jgi:hypothetical protein